MMGAFNMIRQMLKLFSLNNVGLFLQCTAVTFVVFAAIYALVYFVTAKEYYKIVQHE
jgi:putative ABC transport system permease protein